MSALHQRGTGPAQAGTQEDGIIQSRSERDWIPAFAGMTALFPNYDTVSDRRGLALWSKFQYSTG